MEMLKRDEELIAIALGDAQPSQRMKRRLSTDEGRRELESYRRALRMLNTLYADVSVVKPKRVVYFTSMRTPVGRVLAVMRRRHRRSASL